MRQVSALVKHYKHVLVWYDWDLFTVYEPFAYNSMASCTGRCDINSLN